VNLGAYVVVLSPLTSATPGASCGSRSAGLGDGSGSGCSTGEDADLGGCATASLVLEDLDTGVEPGIPTASDARPLCSGGEDEALRPASATTRSPSATSMASTWRSFRWRVSLGGATRRSLSLSAPRRPPGCAREVEARAGESGVEVAGVTEERWNADLERFHHDGIVTRVAGAREEEEEEGTKP